MDKKIRESMNYSVNAGGKRVRPMLMLEVYKLCGGNDCQVVYPFMAALECIHSYHLCMMIFLQWIMMITEEEDLQHIRYSEKISEYLQGDGLLNLAYEIMAEALVSGEGDIETKSQKAMEVIAKKSRNKRHGRRTGC